MNYEDAGYVYAIRNRINGHSYIGSTKNFKSRWHTHRSTLRRNKHHSFVLQRAWDKYGEDAFEFKVLLVCPNELRIFYETKLMSLETYNVLRTPKESGVRGGWTHSEEFKAKMSALHTGKSLTDDHRKKLSLHRTGRKENIEFKEKARNRQLGVVPNASTRKKLSKAMSQFRAEEVLSNMETARKIHARCVAGEIATKALKEVGMAPPTFYRYVAKLGLALLGHKKRGVQQ